jgi:ribosomal protein L11 methyltransferase
MRWAEITIEATAGAQDAVDDALRTVGCDGVLIRDTETPPRVSGYLPVDDRLEGRLDGLQTALAQLSTFGVEGAGTELTLRYVEEADWANAWKAFYKPMRVGRHLVVTPPWETPELGDGDIPLVIDPGMAFGTGSHPTTQLCLVALEDYLQPGMRVADIGTGSGILAIAASKLGASTVTATDIDPLAVRIAAENIGVNSVAVATQEPLPTGAYDLVVANILADVIIGMADTLAELVTSDGLLIASGIIDTREADVRFAVEAAGFSPLETRRQTEWVALIFRRLGA